MHQNTVFITGANGGLARETIKWLIEDGYRDITMAARSQARAEQARQDIIAGNGRSEGITLTPIGGFDMTNPSRLEEAVKQLSREKQFDIVFLQAGGVIFAPDYQTAQVNGQDYERTVLQNVLGGHVTLALLYRYNLVAPNARIIVAGGEGARGLPPLIETPNFDSPEALRRYVTGDFKCSQTIQADECHWYVQTASCSLGAKTGEIGGRYSRRYLVLSWINLWHPRTARSLKSTALGIGKHPIQDYAVCGSGSEPTRWRAQVRRCDRRQNWSKR